jgi:D-alanyl-D-alanine carboxypeptidase
MPRYAEAQTLVDVEPNIVGRMQQLTPETAGAWHAMKTHAVESGVVLLLVSGFRSIERQRALIRKKLDAGQRLLDVLKVTAAPGYSQHHSGQAVDLASPGCRPLTEAFEDTAAFEWLTRNAGAHGFTLSYPRGNACGMSYEPWHWFRLP